MIPGARHEMRHHSDEQVSAALGQAAQLVDELAIADDLRVAAFTAAVNLLTAKQIIQEQLAPSSPLMQVPRGL